MSGLFTVTDDCECDLLNWIEKHLKELSSDDNPKLYFSGEYDSNQTKFERCSNNLQLGVLAYNKITALVLLRFLRIIIDNRPEFLLEDPFTSFVEEFDGNGLIVEVIQDIKQMEISEIVEKISKQEEDYMQCFSLDKPITTNFTKTEYNFVRRLDEIDIWTLPRIMKEMRDIY